MIALPVLLVAVATSPLFTGRADPSPAAEATAPATVATPAATVAPALPAPALPSSASSTPATPESPTAPNPVATHAPGVAPAIVPANTTYQYRFIPAQPKVVTAGAPQIYAVYLNNKKLRSLGPILIRVLTSPNVVKVASSSNGRMGLVPNVGPGDFEANSKLPKLPFVASGITTTIDFIATTAAGKKVTVGVPVELQ